MTKTITLAQGNGDEENNELIKKVFYQAFKNENKNITSKAIYEQ